MRDGMNDARPWLTVEEQMMGLFWLASSISRLLFFLYSIGFDVFFLFLILCSLFGLQGAGEVMTAQGWWGADETAVVVVEDEKHWVD
ncbi:cobalamin biosynthesis protein CbiM [Sesbania bispinosa]|nr:cobalamin biosynthesis protein CbiM [Sesbania bispinosa]